MRKRNKEKSKKKKQRIKIKEDITKGKRKIEKRFTLKNDLYMLVSRESDNRKAQGIATSS
jgi:hypothetical protein